MTLAPLVLAIGLAVAPARDGSAVLDAAIEKAVAWVDALAVDPKALREERSMRGKKYFAEKLFVYRVLAAAEKDGAKRAAFVRKFEAALAPAKAPDFHAFDDGDLKLFREEAMSYLNVLHMTTRLGLDDAEYRRKAAEKVPAIVKDLPNRAVHWQLTIAYFLEKLGLSTAPVTIESLLPRTLLAERRGTSALAAEDVYGLAQEVFVLSGFGDEPVRWPTKDARLYAQAALPFLVMRAVRENDADLLATLLVAMRCAGFEGNSAFADGVRHLLTRQNENGSFGTYERRRAELERAKSRFDVDVGGYLHTTGAAIWALVAARDSGVSISAPAAPTPR